MDYRKHKKEKGVRIAREAVLLGDVELGEDSCVLFYSTIRSLIGIGTTVLNGQDCPSPPAGGEGEQLPEQSGIRGGSQKDGGGGHSAFPGTSGEKLTFLQAAAILEGRRFLRHEKDNKGEKQWKEKNSRPGWASC